MRLQRRNLATLADALMRVRSLVASSSGYCWWQLAAVRLCTTAPGPAVRTVSFRDAGCDLVSGPAVGEWRGWPKSRYGMNYTDGDYNNVQIMISGDENVSLFCYKFTNYCPPLLHC